MPKKKKLALNSGIQTNQILTNDDEVCNPRLSNIFLAVVLMLMSNCQKLMEYSFSNFVSFSEYMNFVEVRNLSLLKIR